MTDNKILTPLNDEAFLLERQTDREIWVKHRVSGHVVCFPVSDDGGTVEEPHRIDLRASSIYDGRRLIPSARRAAHQYLTATGSATA